MKITQLVQSFLKNAPKAYQTPVNRFATFCGDREMSEVTRHEFAAYAKVLNAKYKPMTVKFQLTVIKVFINFCVGEGELKMNTTFLKIPKVFARRTVCKWEEFQKMCNCLMRDSFYELQTLLILKFLGMGMRIGEVTSLNMDDFRDVGMDKMHTIIRSEKSLRERIISWNEETHSLLIKYLALRSGMDKGAWLFGSMEKGFGSGGKGGRLTTRALQRRFETVRKLAGVTSHITPHSVRHMAAHIALEQGADIKVIQLKLGHSNIQSTDNYLRLDPQESVKALNKYRVV